MKRGRSEPNIVIVKGNILKAKEKYIAQQCNCITTHGAGLYKTIASKYPWSDFYKDRKDPDVPGTIRIDTAPDEKRVVIHMLAQYKPGKPSKNETRKEREKWFQHCLKEMEQIDTDCIAFPYCIGCGLAGGDWKVYLSLLKQFSMDSGKQCTIYKLQ